MKVYLFAWCFDDVSPTCEYYIMWFEQPSVKGFGLKNSYKYTLKHNDPVKVLAAMRLAGLMPLEYAAVKTSSTGNPQPQSSHRMLTYELEFHKVMGVCDKNVMNIGCFALHVNVKYIN